MEEPIINRVAKSPIQTINLEHFFPEKGIVTFDLKEYLYMELILKEKDFRTALKEHDWSQYQDKVLCVYCSSDAIIPVWAYMLVAAHASSTAYDVYQGTTDAYLTDHYRQVVRDMDVSGYEDVPTVIKGCSDKPVPPSAYMALTDKLIGVAKSVMYGEPCSTVPIYKKPRKV